MRKPFSTQACKHFLVVLLTISLATSMFLALPVFVANPVYASPDPVVNTDLWYSRPQGYTYAGFVLYPTSGYTLRNPTRSFDTPTSPPLGNDTFAEMNYVRATTGSTYFVGDTTGGAKSFKIPTIRTLAGLPNPSIQRVDVVMTWGANSTSGSGRSYAFQIAVAAGGFVTFQGPQQSAQAKTTQTWSYPAEPGGGAWTWADINKVRIQVLTGTSASADAWMSVYDIKLNVYVKSAPRLFVSPANVTDTTKVVGSTFTVYVQLENISMSAGTEFKLRYDPEVLNITSTTPVPPASPAEDQVLPADFIYATGTMWTYQLDRTKGLFWISYTSGPLAAVPPPTFGSGKVATITFQVLGLGLTTLHLYDSIQAAPGGASIPHDVADGYFRNVAMPYGATMKMVAPTEPVSVPFSVDINITKSTGESGAFGVYSWEFNMTYDKTLINATAIWEGTFFSKRVRIFSQIVGVNKGWVWANSTLNGDYPGVWGNGTLATVDFHILGTGTSPLNFVANKERLTRIDYGLGPPSPRYNLPVTTVNGQVSIGGPVASFTFSPPVPKVNWVVTFDASGSSDLYGTIVSYSWDFGDGTREVFVGANLTQTATHAYGTDGTYAVKLTVEDNNGVEASSTQNVNVLPLVPPVASFTYSPTEPKVHDVVTFNASASYDLDGKITSYGWDFGDGTREVYVGGNLTQTTTHAFDLRGVFPVTLTVTDDDGLTANSTQIVTVSGAPVPTFTYSPSLPVPNQIVTFNASGSYDPDGTIVSYSWDFGDSNITVVTESTTTHVYGAAGFYTVTLNVTDNDGLTTTSAPQTVNVGGLPIAKFTYSPATPKVGYVITFNASDSYDPNGIIVDYFWDFGDGSNGTSKTVTHVYSVNGTYIVKLTVTDNDANSESSTKTVTVNPLVPPIASFTYSPTQPKVNDTVAFDASGSNDPDGIIVDYFWDFGDGSNGTSKTVTHVYSVNGTFTVTLVVTDDDVLTATSTQTVYVRPLIPPVASFTYSPAEPRINQEVTFDASGSSGVDGSIVSYSWNFSDGSSGTDKIVTHVYSSDGLYAVKLTVKDSNGLEGSSTQTVPVKIVHDVAVTSVTVDSTLVETGKNVTINVGVKNLGDVEETFDVNVYFNDTLAAPTQTVLTLAAGADNSLTFIWNTTGVAKGRYEIKAVATPVLGEVDISNNQMSAAQLVWVSRPPVALFTYSPLEPKANEVVTFNASDSSDPDGTIAYYFWDFGDGAVDLGKVVTHKYTNVGVYSVNLTVRDDYTLVDSEVQLVDVSKETSIVTIAASASSATIGSSVVINGSITPKRATVTVTISFSLDGGSWSTLTNRTTDSEGKYTYDWIPVVAGDYQLRASWGGDGNTLPAESGVVSVTFKETSSISVTPTPSTAAVGDSVTVSGLITPKREGASVSIYYRLQGDAQWISLANKSTDTDGKYTQSWVPAKVGVFELMANWTGDAKTLSAESAVATLTINKVPSEVSIALSDSSVDLGSAVTISGSISPKRVSAVVTIQYRISSGVWTKLISVVTDADGGYSYPWTPATAGDYELRAFWDGDASTESDTSVIQALSVEAPQAFPIPLYALAGIIIALLAVVGLAVYFKKFRNR